MNKDKTATNAHTGLRHQDGHESRNNAATIHLPAPLDASNIDNYSSIRMMDEQIQ
jgi:hypothetical protein